MPTTTSPAEPAATPATAADQVRVRLDSSELKSSYCNFCNASSTREEVVLSFGINHSWEVERSDLAVKMQHRIILSPFAAKRLSDMLIKLMRDYEARNGELK